MKGKRNFYNKHIYAAYRGDDYVMDGTLEELCKALGRTRRNLMWCLAPSSKKRQARQKMTKRRLTLVRVDDDDDVSESELEAVARPWRGAGCRRATASPCRFSKKCSRRLE